MGKAMKRGQSGEAQVRGGCVGIVRKGNVFCRVVC